MRQVQVTFTVLLSFGLLAAAPVGAEEVLTAKVYRDYPGYINPAVCENPNLDMVVPTTAPSSTEATPAASPATTPPPATSPASAQKSCPVEANWMRSDNPVGPYAAAWAGMVATDDLEIGSSVDMSVDNGYGAGLAIGYDFGRFRVEVEGSYREGDGDKLKTNAGEVSAPEDLKVYTALLNGYVDFATGGPLTPYLGAGGGYARAELGDDSNDDVGVGQLAAGFLCAVTPEVAVDLGYRFLFPVSESDYDIQQHTAMLGLQIRF